MSSRNISAAFAFFLSGCASLTSIPNGELGITLDHFTKISDITLKDLKDAEGRLELTCPLTHEYNSAYKEKCVKDAIAFVGLANTYWSKYLYPIDASEVAFDDGGVCIDTFIPGREADDCFDFMKVKMEIRYRE